jgi:cytochrome c oxidase cbb3-type subunit 3/ubiquinol-cytochrome c reductase cytochrome c subunit
MRTLLPSSALLLCVPLLCLPSLAGCHVVPGKPAPGSEATRPDQILDFATLYKENCSACHGDNGRMGAAISLANPTYLAFAGAANLQRITANGIPGTMMPAFSQASGGMLTDQQIQILTQGMVTRWSKPSALTGLSPIAYAVTETGDPARGAHLFASTCAPCHGSDGTGSPAAKPPTGSLVDPAYLALISDQGLRSLVVAGQPDQGMPGSGQLSAHPLDDQDVTDIVAWLASHRGPIPGQPYPQPPQFRKGDRNE